MTVQQIIQAVAAVAGGYSKKTFYRDITKLKIVPLGQPRQIPQQYAPSVPAAILALRGYESALLPQTPVLPPLDTAASVLAGIPAKGKSAAIGITARLASMPELRNVRKAARQSSVRKCTRCGANISGEFVPGNTCRNTEACKRRAKK